MMALGRPIALFVLSAALVPVGVMAQASDYEPYFVNVDGASTRVVTLGLQDRGDGDPVLVLQAGAGGGIEGWGGWLKQVAELAPVVAYDRVGLGQSPFDGETPTIERVNQHLTRLLEALDVPPPYVLVGHSWGGPLNHYYAAAHPEAVSGLVHLDPPDPRLTPLENMAASSDAELALRWAEMDSLDAESAATPGVRAEDEYIDGFFQMPVSERSLPADPQVPTAYVFGMLVPDLGDDWLSFGDELIETTFRLRIERVVPRVSQRRNGAVFLTGDAGHMVHLDDPALSLHAVRHVLARLKLERSTFPVDRSVWETFTGEFEHESGTRMSITLDEDGLKSRIEGQGAAPLRAISELVYRVGNGSVTLEFVRDGVAVDALVVHQSGEHAFRRVRNN